MADNDNAAELVLAHTRLYTDHPVKGQLFLDIFPIWRNPSVSELIVSHLAKHIQEQHTNPATNKLDIEAIVCLEARGFFFAPQIAGRLGLPCVPVRKSGKLPGECVSVTFQKEYGPDSFQMKMDAFEGIGDFRTDDEGEKKEKHNKVILIDDFLAFGGSARAAKELVDKLGMVVAEAVFIFDVDSPFFQEKNKANLGDLKRFAMVHLKA
ncbi:adenine phosphoribosyltransferase [Phlyctema vagabunda]|uniref:adenine phosphoribosyltransferase n=1 Tax=Phlyctema vagabunda TaxID=108571 RepID=A0ABR4PD52_9HELO